MSTTRGWATAGLLAGCALSLGQGQARAQVLYDGAQGNLVDEQTWLAFLATGTITPPTAGPAGTTLPTTTDPAQRAGYFSHIGLPPVVPVQPANVLFPVLSAATGFTLRFGAQLQSESHTSGDRAGFSVIALSSTGAGVELGFWANEVWAQNGGAAPALFTHGEGAVFNTHGALVQYDLAVFGQSYTVYADGLPILSGALRDYSAFDAAAAGLPFNPYTTPNFVFLGDNTSSAGASVLISRIEIIPTAIPTPGSVGLLMVGALCLLGTRPRRRTPRHAAPAAMPVA